MSHNKSSLAALTLGAIGVVYGDIGTSVLYAIKEIFGSGHVPFTHANHQCEKFSTNQRVSTKSSRNAATFLQHTRKHITSAEAPASA